MDAAKTMCVLKLTGGVLGEKKKCFIETLFNDAPLSDHLRKKLRFRTASYPVFLSPEGKKEIPDPRGALPVDTNMLHFLFLGGCEWHEKMFDSSGGGKDAEDLHKAMFGCFIAPPDKKTERIAKKSKISSQSIFLSPSHQQSKTAKI
uniref:Uncharacterized protein n=1 Tax=Chromera velia CCMP2878 TaxID=1169474 RepID=A0A0G4GTU6_9ALVE|eukprot:Cvel_23368.t1-p1 / transcript=Cvel_23368.t1 / gene=Cvel_23368 / organism=Chromera_velia_CCMP2878 / gene_product=hypothetical protein / transcript_product=hypothetical protein / location=Cvel_scaffold2399:26439-26876(+) / protein_length=146 / sequence_SO=supercontig / SO=protein_coding / is_pseudo=false